MNENAPILVSADLANIEIKMQAFHGGKVFLKETIDMNDAMSGGGVSLKPSQAQAGGGGLFDDLDAWIIRCYFRLWDYNGAISTPVLGLSVVYKRLDEEGGEFEQTYSGGDTKFNVPSPDGKRAIPVDKERTGLTEGTNALQYLVSIVNCGFPEHLIGDDVSVFEGIQVHVNRVPQQKRPGIAPKPVVAGAAPKKDDILVVTKILNKAQILDGSYKTVMAAQMAQTQTQTAPAGAPVKKAKPPAAAQAPVPAQAPGPVADDAVRARAIDVVMGILTEKGGSIAKAEIASAAFKVLQAAKDPLRNQVSQLVFKDEFLGDKENVPWSFDGTTISLG